ncbi:MAG TPA: DNA polymerase IV [Feifaniaceae bacterium]|nr:DNA polymerase IV [Feifaniaceae bacterium]
MPESDRVIFHIDCNSFYASVEELLYPEYKKVPMAVCGNPEARRGIILAKNELAKSFGVKTAETIWQAQRKCPTLTLRPARHHLYREYCERVNAIYGQYTSQVQRFGIDESYLDVTGSLHLFGGDAFKLAHEIRQRVTRETGLTVSVGVSWCKVFAKLGSDLKKPDAVSVISRENYKRVVWPMPVGNLLFVGRNMAENLSQLGVRTIGELAHMDPELLCRRLGKLGSQLHAHANGQDDSPVLEIGQEEELRSVGNGMTFSRNLITWKDIHTSVTVLSDSVAARMRRHGVKGAAVQVTIKDQDLKVITRQKPLTAPSYLAADLSKAAMELIEASWKIGTPIRMLTVTALKLVPEGMAAEQISLLEDSRPRREKRERLEKTLDTIRDKFGRGSILPSSVLHNDLGIDERDE